jgi:hypothetical protein
MWTVMGTRRRTVSEVCDIHSTRTLRRLMYSSLKALGGIARSLAFIPARISFQSSVPRSSALKPPSTLGT